jgi:hypothetical protein
MSKKIETLAQDIYHVLDPTQDHEADPLLSEGAAGRIADELQKATQKRDAPREVGKLWASDLGKPCMRQHWYNFNQPELGEQISGHTKFKFLYGNLLEEAVLHYAAEADHDVRYTQERVEHSPCDDWTISGRIDAVIDNTLIDVKTTSSYGYKKYTTEGLNAANDTFGYLYQLGFYRHFGDFTDELEDVSGFVWIDKQNGHIAYTPVELPTAEDIRDRAECIISAVEGGELDADRAFLPKPYGKSGNMCLDTGCSYCPFKQQCWRDANHGQGLQGYLYSHGPVWFTDVARLPKASVPRLDQEV